MELKVINLKNEKGNIRVSVRNGITKSFKEKLIELLEENTSYEVGETERNTIFIEIGQDKEGNPIYMEVKASLTQKSPDETSKKKSGKKKEEKIEVPKLF